MNAEKFDVCECGDYRHQHEGSDGHGNCIGCMYDCRQFRIFERMTPMWEATR